MINLVFLGRLLGEFNRKFNRGFQIESQGNGGDVSDFRELWKRNDNNKRGK